MTRIWIPLGALNAFLAVTMGAFAAHALKGRDGLDDAFRTIFKTGAEYHMTHALALVLFGLFLRQARVKSNLPGILFTVGIVLFSGSLYLVGLTGITKFGIITPVGGLCFLGAWLFFAMQAWKDTR